MAETEAEAIAGLTDKITDLESVGEGVITLLSTLAGEIRDNVNDAPALTALADRVDSLKTKFAAAVVANTPVADEPPVETPPTEEPPAEPAPEAPAE